MRTDLIVTALLLAECTVEGTVADEQRCHDVPAGGRFPELDEE